MIQPTIPPRDEETRQEKDEPPLVAGETKAIAPKEAAGAEVKANEATDAKRASE